MTLHEALTEALKACATDMALVLGMEGEVFTPPLSLHLRGKVVWGSATQGTLGTAGVNRVDGTLEVMVCGPAGASDAAIMPTVTAVQKKLRRGRRVICAGGGIVLMTSSVTVPSPRQDRRRMLVLVPFYALLKELSQ